MDTTQGWREGSRGKLPPLQCMGVRLIIALSGAKCVYDMATWKHVNPEHWQRKRKSAHSFGIRGVWGAPCWTPAVPAVGNYPSIHPSVQSCTRDQHNGTFLWSCKDSTAVHSILRFGSLVLKINLRMHNFWCSMCGAKQSKVNSHGADLRFRRGCNHTHTIIGAISPRLNNQETQVENLKNTEK